MVGFPKSTVYYALRRATKPGTRVWVTGKDGIRVSGHLIKTKKYRKDHLAIIETRPGVTQRVIF